MRHHPIHLPIALIAAVLLASLVPSAGLRAESEASTAPLIPLFQPPHLSKPFEARVSAYTLADLSGNSNDIVLRGAFPSYFIYTANPEEWKLNGITLHLNITHSDVLRNDSTLTVEINDTPVGSLQLTPENIGPTIWDVDVLPELLVSGPVTIKFQGYMRVSDDICADIENAGNWVRVAADSKVEYNFDPLPLQPKLERLPYPFIRPRSLTSDAAVLVVPPSATSAELVPALYLASSLGSQATWRGVKLYALAPNEVTDSVKSDYDLILIGRADRLTLIQELAANWPLTFGGGAFTSPTGQTVSGDIGVVMMIASPWNPTRGVLAVTGSTDAAVTNAALALRQPQFANLARGDYALIVSPPQGPAAETAAINWNSVTLQALGYSNETVNGLGKHTINYSLNLPNSQTPQSLTITVRLSHSPFVTTDRSYVVLAINDNLQNGVFLNKQNEQNGTWEVEIPASQLQPGENTLQILFDLHLPDYEACDDLYLDRAWATINADTSLSAKFSNVTPVADLSQFPVPFDAGSLIVLPAQLGPNERAGLFQLFTNLGARMGGRTAGLALATADQVGEAALTAKNVILYGDPATNPWVNAALQSAPVRFDGSARSLQTDALKLSIADGESVGLIELLPSPWDKSHTAMIITGADDAGVGWATNLLVDPKLFAQLKGDVAVVDLRGYLTTLDSRTPAQVAEEVTNVTEAVSGPSLNIVQIALIIAAGLIALGLIVILLRRRMAQ